MVSLERYLLKNGLEQFNNEKSKEHLVEVMSGGSDCKGLNIFKYTMSNFHNKPLLVKELQGGRLVLPMEYFGAPNKHYHQSTDVASNYSDITVSNIKQALPINQMNGGNMNNTNQKAFMRKYNQNLEHFVRNLKTLTGGNKITKKMIDASMSKLAPK